MPIAAGKLSETFKRFIDSERSAGLLLIVCMVISITAANSVVGQDYLAFWQAKAAGLSIEHWVNEGLMAMFFLLIGLELERELRNGELSNLRTASLPAIAAMGGVMLPAAIHFALNVGTPTQAGVGIPMATDIGFTMSIFITNLAFAGDAETLMLQRSPSF